MSLPFPSQKGGNDVHFLAVFFRVTSPTWRPGRVAFRCWEVRNHFKWAPMAALALFYGFGWTCPFENPSKSLYFPYASDSILAQMTWSYNLEALGLAASGIAPSKKAAKKDAVVNFLRGLVPK